MQQVDLSFFQECQNLGSSPGVLVYAPEFARFGVLINIKSSNECTVI